MRDARLGDVVVSMKNGLYKPATEYADDGTPCLRMYNIDAGSIVWRDIKRMRVSAAELEEYGLREGDLLVNRVNSRELVGKAAFIPPSLEPSVFESKNIRVRLDVSKALPNFVNYQLLAGGRSHFAGNAQQVVGMASISQKQLADFPIVLTDLEEQRRIVAEIEKQISRLDEAVANLKRVKANLERHHAAVLDAAVKGRIGAKGTASDDALPTGWQWSSVGELATVGTGATPARSNEAFYRGGTIPWITSSAVNERFVDAADQFVTNEALRETNLTLYPSGTLLVAMYGEGKTRGKCSELRIAATTNQALAALQVDPTVRPWLRLFLEHNYDNTRRIASGGVQPNLNLGLIRSIRLPLPPVNEQHRIVAEVDRRLSIVREVEAEVDANLRRAEALRQAVLQRAFCGQLVEQPKPSEAAPTRSLIHGTLSLQQSARIALSAEIVHRQHAHWSFGQTKHQKVYYLAEHIARIHTLDVPYMRLQRGPANLVVLKANEAALERMAWYAERRRDGSRSHRYVALTHAGAHTPYLTSWLDDERLTLVRRVIEALREWDTDRCERVATVYAAWNDLLLWKKEPTSEAILHEVLTHWHEDKGKKHSVAQWHESIEWLKRQGWQPTGFGHPTRDGATGDLFEDEARY